MLTVQAQRRSWRGLILAASVAMVSPAASGSEKPVGTVQSFRLDNGLEVVVVADHRVPVVTHMVWYKVGSIDDPPGASGLAHLLEHLMFKSFDAMSDESFAETISRIGGRDNAVTRHDSTHYYQRVAKRYLGDVMALEARRMRSLRLTEQQVLVERDVVREERRANVESDPVKLLTEQIMGALHRNHSYARPPIGWAHELQSLTLAQTEKAYRDFYAPNNAILVVAGDVLAEDVRRLAESTYGPIPASALIGSRSKTIIPESLAGGRFVMRDERTTALTVLRYYLTPSAASAQDREAEALELLAIMLGSGESSLLHKQIVADRRQALSAGARYFSEGRDYGRLVIFANAAEAAGEILENAIDDVVAPDALAASLTEAALAQAKAIWDARYIYATDNQMELASRYGEALAAGRTLSEITSVPHRVAQTSLADVRNVAAKYIIAERSITGVISPKAVNGVR